jgi:hypothetical protein
MRCLRRKGAVECNRFNAYWLLPWVVTLLVACGSGGSTAARGINEEEVTYGGQANESGGERAGSSTEPCQDDDPRVECRRSLHHYDEFERSTQNEVYRTGSSGGY